MDNMLIALRRGDLGAGSPIDGKADAEMRKSRRPTRFVGYAGAVERQADELSHVDRRLVEIARALAIRPSVLALDEPAAGFDPEDSAAIGALLRKLAAAGMTVLAVEHDMDLVMAVSDQVVVLDAGAEIAEGRPP